MQLHSKSLVFEKHAAEQGFPEQPGGEPVAAGARTGQSLGERRRLVDAMATLAITSLSKYLAGNAAGPI
jgi:hypothetical protein